MPKASFQRWDYIVLHLSFQNGWRTAQHYGRIRLVLSADRDQQRDFQSAQRLWLKFGDANCQAERNLYSGGRAAPMVYAACVEADTRQRTSDLKAMYGWRLEKFGKTIEWPPFP